MPVKNSCSGVAEIDHAHVPSPYLQEMISTVSLLNSVTDVIEVISFLSRH